MTNERNTVLYIGVTSDISRRVYEHKSDTAGRSFTSRYNVCKLVHLEETEDVEDALAREKQLKGWLRVKKVDLINASNPDWRDLLPEEGAGTGDSSRSLP